MTRLISNEMTEEVEITYGLCQAISTEDFGMRCVSAKFVP
jgi:hypothetical protein